MQTIQCRANIPLDSDFVPSIGIFENPFIEHLFRRKSIEELYVSRLVLVAGRFEILVKLYSWFQDFVPELCFDFGEGTGFEEPGREDVVQLDADSFRSSLKTRLILG